MESLVRQVLRELDKERTQVVQSTHVRWRNKCNTVRFRRHLSDIAHNRSQNRKNVEGTSEKTEYGCFGHQSIQECKGRREFPKMDILQIAELDVAQLYLDVLPYTTQCGILAQLQVQLIVLLVIELQTTRREII